MSGSPQRAGEVRDIVRITLSMTVACAIGALVLTGSGDAFCVGADREAARRVNTPSLPPAARKQAWWRATSARELTGSAVSMYSVTTMPRIAARRSVSTSDLPCGRLALSMREC